MKYIILYDEERFIEEKIFSFLSFGLALFISSCYFFEINFFFNKITNEPFYYIFIFFGSLIYGVLNLYTIQHHFDLENNFYRKFFILGFVGIGKWKLTNELNYVALNQVNGKDIFEINIWDIKNIRLKISYHDNKETAIKYGLYYAEKLNLGYFDREEFN